MNYEQRFKVGDTVLCIQPAGWLEYGKSYKVLGVTFDEGALCLNKDEATRNTGWFVYRFVLATPLMEALL